MHTRTIVFLPAGTAHDDKAISDAIQGMFAPYYSEMEVAPHEWCPVHNNAKSRFTTEYPDAAALAAHFPKHYKIDHEGRLHEHITFQGYETPCTFNHDGQWDYWNLGDETPVMEASSVSDREFGTAVTPDGKWHDLMNFGWRMMNSDEENATPHKNWQAHLEEIFARHGDAFCVVLDVHS